MAAARGDAMSTYRARLVTVSASYGAGGAVVAPALAERLGVPFLQRATTSSGGSSGPEPCFERLGPEEARLTPAHRLLASLMQTVPLGPTQSPIPASLSRVKIFPIPISNLKPDPFELVNPIKYEARYSNA